MSSEDIVNEVIETKELRCEKFGISGTPVAQQSSIADPAETTGGNNTAIDSILAVLRTMGIIAT